MFSLLARIFKRLLSLAVFAAIGAVVLGVLNQGRPDAVIAGAILGAGFIVAVWFIRAVFRRLFRTGRKAGVGTILDISSNPPPGAPWYYHTHVLFDVKGRRLKLKLTPEQARHFSANYSMNDTGRLVWAGKSLVTFELPTPDRPMSSPGAGVPSRKVFISYAHGDDPAGQAAEYLAQVFQSAGLETWLDKAELAPGDKLRKQIAARIAQADFFVPMLSAEYMSSPWCLREFETAADSGIEIVPVKTSAGRLVAPPDMARLFAEKAGEPRYLDLTQRGYLDELRDLARRMSA